MREKRLMGIEARELMKISPYIDVTPAGHAD
jgi:hypothetical protein